MAKKSKSLFSDSIEKLFSSGTVILFTCAATSDFPILWVSPNAEDILGFRPSHFEDNENGWSKRIHPDEKNEVISRFEKVIKKGNGAINEYRFKTKEGNYIWLRDEIQVIEEDGQQIIYGSSIDITKRKKAEIKLKENKTEELRQEIERRRSAEQKLQKGLEYEKIISECSKLLLESNSPKALRKSLQLLQEVTEADRIFLYKNNEIDGELYLDPVVEVTKAGVDPVIQNLDEQFKYSDFPWLHKKLSSLSKVHAQVDELPEPEHTILKEQQVESILIIPFAVEDEWKGYIGFADTHQKRLWNEEEISLLGTISRIIAAFEKRKTIEQTLLEQRNYTNAILESLPSIYLLMDNELKFIQWNKNAERYTGYSAEELETKKAFDLIAPEDHEDMQKAIEEARGGDMEYGTELHLKQKSGEKIPYLWHGYFIEFSGAEYFLCMGINITQQKEAKEELRNEKRFSEALLESLPGVFYMFDKDGNFHRWNQNLLDETGYSAEDMKQLSPAALFESKEYERVEKEIQKVYKTGKSELETRLKTKDGKKIPYYFTGTLFQSDSDEYLLGVGYDITEQVEAREKLQKSEKMFRNLFLNAPAGIVMVDPDNTVQDINKSFEEIFGFSKDELIGKDIDNLILPEEERGKVPRMPLKKYSSENFYREAKRLTKNGELIDVFLAAIPVYINDKPIAGFGMYIDITEEKRYEQQLSNSLKEKQTLLKEIHHRVKNNLAIVSGLLQLQMYEMEDPVIQDILKESERRIQTMALIHEKLYNSQNLGYISCDTYIGELIETIRHTIGSDQQVEVNTNIECIELEIDRAVPFALLINEVVTNSFKHAFNGQENNLITIEIIEKEEGEIYAQISDNGIGLPGDIDPEMSDSLGMSLIDSFTQQLDAEWEMGTDEGTYITLQFSVARDGNDTARKSG